MGDKRRRLNSSMTFEEYQEIRSYSPKTPQLKPIKEIPTYVPEMSLTCDTPIQTRMCSLCVIPEEEKMEICHVPITNKHIKKRQRFQSENIQYTFMNFMEKGIMRRKSQKFTLK